MTFNPLPSVPPPAVHHPWPFHRCGTCGGETFTTTPHQSPVVFTCLTCDRRWRYTLGYLIELDTDHTPERDPHPAPASALTSNVRAC